MEANFAAIFAVLAIAIMAGFLPGFHPNSIGAVMVGAFGNAPWIPVALVILLGAHVSCEFFASIFMGVPDGDTEVSALPGVRMMLDGRGLEAARTVAFSVVASTALAIALTPLALSAMPILSSTIEPVAFWVLLFAAALLLWAEGKPAKIAKAVVVFALAGALGAITLQLSIKDALFPMFVGFFTIPGIFLSGHGKMKKVLQKDEALSLDFGAMILLGVLLGGLADLVPGISTPAQIAVFASLLVPLDDAKKFMALCSSIAASHAVFAISAAASIGAPRVGAVALAHGAEPITASNLPLLLAAFALAAGSGAYVLVVASKIAGKYIASIDFDSAGKLLSAYLVAAIFLAGGFAGILVLLCASAIGTLPIIWKIRRTHVMGGIIAPSIMRLAGA